MMDWQRLFLKTGMVESVRGKAEIQFKCTYNGPFKWDTAKIQAKYPGLAVNLKMEDIRHGFPYEIEYTVTGPKDQLVAFIEEYGNENLKQWMREVTGSGTGKDG